MNKLLWWMLWGLLPISVRAVAPDVVLTRSYDVRADFGQIIPADTLSRARSFYIAGTAVEGQFQFYGLKIDSVGDTVWTRRMGNTDQAFALAGNRSLTAVLAGTTFENNSADYRVRALTDSGTSLYTYVFGSDTISERARTVDLRFTGGLLIGGEVAYQTTQPDVTLIALDASGDYVWSRRYTTGARLSSVLQMGNTYRVIGTADSVADLGFDYWMLDTDSTGTGQWFHRWGTAASEIAAEALHRSSGFTTIAGSQRVGALRDVWILMLNSSSDSVRSFYWRTAGDDVATCIADAGDPDSGFVIGGYTVADSVTRGFLARYSGDGDSLWTIFFAQDHGVRIADVFRDSTFRYHAVGSLLTASGPRGLYVMTDPDPTSPGQQPPNRFSLLDPAPFDTVFNDTIFFDWEDAVDPDGDGVRYTVQVDEDTLFQPPYRVFGPIFVSRYIWATDTDDVFLYWRVIASDQFNNIRVCSDRARGFWRFLPDSTRPFHLTEPDSGLALPHLSQRFTWERPVDPDWNDSLRYTINFVTADTVIRIAGLRDTFITVGFQDTVTFPPVSPVQWYVTAQSYFDSMSVHSTETWPFVTWSLAADEQVPVVLEFGIQSVYPNPFNAQTRISYVLPTAGPATLVLYDLTGRLVTTLADGYALPGAHTAGWDGTGYASGIYVVRLTAGTQIALSKLLLLK